MSFCHIPVLLRETVENLALRPDGVYVDGTVGGGGHAFEVASRLKEGGLLIGVDQDGAAIQAAGERLRPFSERVRLVRDNYLNLPSVLTGLGIGAVDGICLDLGVSSHQLDTPERGFSYLEDGAALDMRMDRRQERTAADLVNECPERELARIIREYGEDRFAGKIARNIAEARKKKRIETAGELTRIIRASIPLKLQMESGGHPAMRTFQALRIELNGELKVLENSIDRMIDLLKPGGRLCIITFHSLEDRIVKNGFRRNENPCICPPDFPLCVCGRKSKGRVLTKKPIVPSAREREENPRSRSAKLRVFERSGRDAEAAG